jgi:hypothetical protein
MTLADAQNQADKTWALWQSNPSPSTHSAAIAAFDNLVRVQLLTPSHADWTGSPDTQPLGS